MTRKALSLQEVRVTIEGRSRCPFSPASWSTMSVEDRQSALNLAEQRIAAIEKRDLCSVYALSEAEARRRGKPWRADDLARYDDNTRAIELRSDRLSDGTLFYRVFSDYLHEARHAYQHDVMRCRTVLIDGRPRESEKTIALWEDGKKTYPTWIPRGADAIELWNVEYYKNRLEKDAREWARLMLETMYGKR